MTAPAMVRIATRGSQLALWQANHVKARLLANNPGLQVELVVLTTTGDRILDTTLAKVGGKGLFVKEIEQALLDRTADLAVHSMKDVPPVLADGLMLCAVSVGETPADALCARRPVTLATLPQGAKVGTSSMRRQCQLLAARPDLEIAMLRGNVPTRLAKLDAGDYDAIVLAHAGLVRLGLGHRVTEVLAATTCLPAVAQGVLGIECRVGDDEVASLARAAMHDDATALRVTAERAFLAAMGGSCATPLAAHATLTGDALAMEVLCGMPDGSKVLRRAATRALGVAGSTQQRDAATRELGEQLAAELRAAGADEILASTR